MMLLVVGLGLLGVFLLRFRSDRRRLSNGVFLLLGLAFAGVWLIGSGAKGDLPVVLAGLLVLLSPLLVLVLAGLLMVNGGQMVRREGLRVANLLPLGLGIALLVPYVWLAVAIFTGDIWVVVILASVTMAVSYIGFLFASFLLYSLFYGALPYRPGMDAIVVHGSGLVGARVPPLLANRLDRAIEVYRAELAAGRRPLLITSGGKGSDEAVSEASAMASYLVDNGVPADAVVQEDRSTTTRENLLFTKRLLGERGESTRMVLVTSNFHILRTAILARRLDLDAEVTGSRTAFYYLPSAILREFAAIVVAYKWINVLTCAALMALPVLALLLTRDMPHHYGD
ncbi:YdcF family protein [Nocardia sp. CS682]|nr:YdcF family protein [Nocardia sp. CS682]